MENELMDMSVNITTLNRSVALTMLLESIYYGTKLPAEIVIVDGSNPRIDQYFEVTKMILALKLKGVNVKVLMEEQPSGNCQARNQAVRNSTYEIISRLDDDSILTKDYLERQYNLITNATKKVGAVGGIVPFFGVPRFFVELPTTRYFDTIEFDKDGNIIQFTANAMNNYLEEKIFETCHIQSCMVFRKEAWKQIGGFPEDYSNKVAFREETDFCLRLAWAGWKMLVDTGAIAWHNQASQGGCRDANYNAMAMNDNNYFMKKVKYRFEKNGDPFEKEGHPFQKLNKEQVV